MKRDFAVVLEMELGGEKCERFVCRPTTMGGTICCARNKSDAMLFTHSEAQDELSRANTLGKVPFGYVCHIHRDKMPATLK